MLKKQRIHRLITGVKRLPLRTTLPVVVFIFLGVFYIFAFVVDKKVQFSYTGPTCVKQLTVLPELHKVSGESDYIIHAADKVTLGRTTLLAFSLCFTPKEPPQKGETKVRTAPFGGWLARRTYTIVITPPVTVFMNKLTKPIPISKPLNINMSDTDRVYSYALKVDNSQASCHSLGATLSCDVHTLKLAQGKTYRTELERQFNGKKVATVAQKNLLTLSATRITDSSIKARETVYSKPKTIDLVFDKKVAKATSTLYRLEGEKRTKLPIATRVVDKGIQVSITEELTRSTDYELIIDKVEATDGSGLEGAHKIAFKTSGGPKVTGANIGTTSVPLGTTVVISFDQPLSEKQEIGKFIALSGGATLVGKKGNQLLVSLKNVPKCGDFNINITNDIQSNYEIGGHSAWRFTGRTICHTIGTIGYSHRGRPINAYYFGSGPQTVLFTGAIHGSERSTKSLMERWIRELEVNARKIPGKQVIVVPTVNPDGITAGSRTNARNVDLNRNFGTGDWKTDVTDINNRPFPGGGGPSPMSEPETVAIASLVQRSRPVVVLSYHSIGGVVAANQAGNSSSFASIYSQLSGYRNTTGQTGDTFEYGISGTADDWYAEKLGIASVLIELNSHSYHQFERNQSAMWAMVNG